MVAGGIIVGPVSGCRYQRAYAGGMSHILQILARVEVPSIDEALATYEQLTGGAPVTRFAFADIQLAWIGPFLLLEGPSASLRAVKRVATIIIDDVKFAADSVIATGGVLLDGPAPGPNGQRLVAQHADGSVFEYIESN